MITIHCKTVEQQPQIIGYEYWNPYQGWAKKGIKQDATDLVILYLIDCNRCNKFETFDKKWCNLRVNFARSHSTFTNIRENGRNMVASWYHNILPDKSPVWTALDVLFPTREHYVSFVYLYLHHDMGGKKLFEYYEFLKRDYGLNVEGITTTPPLLLLRLNEILNTVKLLGPQSCMREHIGTRDWKREQEDEARKIASTLPPLEPLKIQ